MARIFSRDWPAALAALWRLRKATPLSDVITVIQNLEGPSLLAAYRRMESTAEGRAIIAARGEVSDRLSDAAWLARFPAGTVGAAYRDFMGGRLDPHTVSRAAARGPRGVALRTRVPLAWLARRIGDMHDVVHVLTGYATDRRGEAATMAFTYGQLGSLGYLAIAAGASLLHGPGRLWRAYRRGKRAAWVFGLDVEALFAENLADARRRLAV